MEDKVIISTERYLDLLLMEEELRVLLCSEKDKNWEKIKNNILNRMYEEEKKNDKQI